MPSRYVVLSIVAFWLASMSWLFYRDIRPRLGPDNPPPFSIDLADEAHAHQVRWTLFRDGKRHGYADTFVHYRPEDDTFDVHGVFKLWYAEDQKGTADQTIESIYRVTRDGDLRAIRATVTLAILGATVTGELTGRIQGGRFAPHLHVTGPSLNLERELDAVEVTRRASVLNPLQPVNRLAGVHRGQRWRTPVVDPLANAISVAVQHKPVETKWLQALVLPETQALDMGRDGLVPALVVEYTGEDIMARTWVREIDGLVLRQEVTRQGETLALQRDEKLTP
jgi:hypothetical protein